MTPEEQRVTLAKSQGMTEPFHMQHWAGIPRLTSGEGSIVPNYLYSIDAMHKVQESLSDSEWDAYCDLLGGSLRACAHATAKQRADAFIVILNKRKQQ